MRLMPPFPGGSAYATVREIAGGFLLVTERTFKRYDRAQLGQLSFEIDRHLMEIRAAQPSLDDLPAIQKRNRTIQRLNATRLMLRAYLSRLGRSRKA